MANLDFNANERLVSDELKELSLRVSLVPILPQIRGFPCIPCRYLKRLEPIDPYGQYATAENFRSVIQSPELSDADTSGRRNSGGHHNRAANWYFRAQQGSAQQS